MGDPTRPDDLSELRRHVEAMADEGLSFESAHAYQEARQALADAAPRLLDEIERLRARPTRDEIAVAIAIATDDWAEMPDSEMAAYLEEGGLDLFLADAVSALLAKEATDV